MVLGMLDSIQIVIEAPATRTRSRADQAALYNLVNQTARIFAHVRLEVRAGAAAASTLTPLASGSITDALESLRRDLAIETAQQPLETLHLSWGCDPSGAGVAGDGSGWTYSVGPYHIPLSEEPGAPALGGIAATNFLAAQALGQTLKPLGFPCFRTKGFVANLLDYQLRPALASPNTQASVIPALALFGCGSVGSSAVYCALLAGIGGGPLDAVDGDTFKERNLFRYPILRTARTDPKAPWLAEMGKAGEIDAIDREGSIQDFLETFADTPRIDLAAVSVDTVDGRRDATDALARTTLNVGALGLKLHIARHGFGDSGCAYCQYVDVDPPLSASAALAEQTGLTVERVIELEISGELLSSADIAAIDASGKLGGDPPSVGERLADLRRQVYAQAVVPIAEGEVLVAAPFVSTQAGLLLLAEAVKHPDPSLEGQRLDGRVDFDMSGEPSGFVSDLTRDETGRCLCYSPHRQRAYRALHGADL